MTEESYKELTVDEVLEAIQKGEITTEQALNYELSGKNRKTLLDELKEILEPSDDVAQDNNDNLEPEPRLHVVTFNKNVKVGKVRYKMGEKTEVSEEEYHELLETGVIQVGD